MKSRIFIVFGVLIALCAAIFLIIMVGGSRTRTLSNVIQKYEFTELTPPSTLVLPGTIVTEIKENPLVVGIICQASEAFGPELQTKLVTSDSATSTQVAEFTGEFKLSATAQQQITMDLDAKYVRNITVSLSSVKIIELPDSVVFDLIGRRTGPCSKALAFRREKGRKITMITSAIQATAVYQVEFDGNLNADARAQLTRGIASTLGLANGIKSNDTIQGEGLIWGVRDDVSLASINADAPPSTGAGKHSRALPFDKFAKVVADAD